MQDPGKHDHMPVRRFGPAHWTWIIGIWIIVVAVLYSRAGKYTQFPLDSYYYLEMAKNFSETGRPVIRFEQGIPNKFFPGYAMLLGAASLFSEPVDTWLYLQLLLYLATSVLLLRLLIRLNSPPFITVGTVALFSSNYIMLKWGGLPVAEPAAVFWTILAANIALSHRRLPARACACGLILGIATLTRPDAVIYPLVFAVWFASTNRPKRSGLMWSTAMLLLAALPVFLYLILKQYSDGEALPYVREFAAHRDNVIQFDMFIRSIMKMYQQPSLLHDVQIINIIIILMHLFFVFALAIGLRGIQGGKVFRMSLIVVVYLAAHTFWYYSTERFNLLVLAPSAFVTCGVLAWYIFQNHSPVDGRISLYYIVIGVMVIVQILYGVAAVTDHQHNLSINVGKPRLLAELANEKPGIAWSEIGPEFAHFFKGQTYIDSDELYFYRRTTQAGDFFSKNDVNWILTKLSGNDWFSTHPDVSSATLSLRPNGNDGIHTLYEVVRQ